MNGGRVPLPPGEAALFETPSFTAEECRRLLAFYAAQQRRNLAFFVSLRERWLAAHPGARFPGLCANVHPLTGELRPDAEQRLWGWGDGRALATWVPMLADGRVVRGNVTLENGTSVDLGGALGGYADLISRGLVERHRLNGGRIPFRAHPASGLADDHPANRVGHGQPDFCAMFAAGGLVQYGMWRGDAGALELGRELFERELALAARSPQYGPRMIMIGVIVDLLKAGARDAAAGAGDGAVRPSGADRPDWLGRDRLVEAALPLIDHVFANHYREDGAEVGRPEGAAFWETSDEAGRPVADASGAVVVDPGHATEFAAFLAELAAFLPVAQRERVVDAALAIHQFADRIGFTPSGVMSKYVDLRTGAFLPDTQAAAASGGPSRPAATPRATAPWWNVREHSAGALRLYVLTRDRRLVESYRRAQRASYTVYPNLRIGGQMIQTVDPFTLEPLDLAPATGNLDPMHDARSREREMACLEELLAEGDGEPRRRG